MLPRIGKRRGKENKREGRVQRTQVLALLRSALIDLLATGDMHGTSAAVRRHAGASI